MIHDAKSLSRDIRIHMNSNRWLCYVKSPASFPRIHAIFDKLNRDLISHTGGGGV